MMKKAAAILLAVLVFVSGIAIVIKSHNDDKNRAHTQAESENMTRLVAQRRALEREMEEKRKEYEENTPENNGCLVLFVDNIEQNLISEAFPMIYGIYGYHATAVMSDLKTPGDEGCITLDEYKMLADSGWDFAIGAGSVKLSSVDGEKKLEDYIAAYRKKLEEKDIPMPQTFCFDVNGYDEKFDDILWNNGFKVVRHYGETGEKFSKSVVLGKIYHLACGRICTGVTTMKADIGEALDSNYTYSASVRYVLQETQENNIDCTYSKYKQMLDYIYGSPIVTAGEIYDKKTEALSEYGEYVDDFNVQMADMEERLRKINDEITAIVE